jgi:hypothetical protein
MKTEHEIKVDFIIENCKRPISVLSVISDQGTSGDPPKVPYLITNKKKVKRQN